MMKEKKIKEREEKRSFEMEHHQVRKMLINEPEKNLHSSKERTKNQKQIPLSIYPHF